MILVSLVYLVLLGLLLALGSCSQESTKCLPRPGCLVSLGREGSIGPPMVTCSGRVGPACSTCSLWCLPMGKVSASPTCLLLLVLGSPEAPFNPGLPT